MDAMTVLAPIPTHPLAPSSRRAPVVYRLAPGIPTALEHLAFYLNAAAEVAGREQLLPSQVFELAVRESARRLTEGRIA